MTSPVGGIVVVVVPGINDFPFKMQLPLDVHTIQGALSPGYIVIVIDLHGEGGFHS